MYFTEYGAPTILLVPTFLLMGAIKCALWSFLFNKLK